MGVFLQTALFPGCDESAARAAVETAAKNPAFQIDLKTCRYAQNFEGTQVLMEGDCLGFATLAKALADLSENPVMLLYIYDGDFGAMTSTAEGKRTISEPARTASAPSAREKSSASPAIRRRWRGGSLPGIRR